MLHLFIYLLIPKKWSWSLEQNNCLHCSIELQDTENGLYLKNYTSIKVSATLQDRPRADRCSVSCFYKNPYKPYIFKSLIIPDYGFELTKTIYSNVFRNWNALCKSTRLYKSCSTPAGNKRKKTINTAFASQHVPLKKPCPRFSTSAFAFLLLATEVGEGN